MNLLSFISNTQFFQNIAELFSFHPDMVKNISIFDYVLSFFVFSAIGWFIESTYVSIAHHKLTNRGFLTGPLCPIYGSGAVVFMIILTPFYKMWYLVFLIGMVAADIVEYITSYTMEKLFHARWWDYSSKRFNLHGRICLRHTFFWGIASLGYIYIIQPVYFKIYTLVPQKIRYIILGVIFAIFLADLANAVRTALDIRKVIDKIQALKASLIKTTDGIRTSIENRYGDIKQGVEKRGVRFAAWTAEKSRQIDEMASSLEKAFEKYGGSHSGKRHNARSFLGSVKIHSQAKSNLTEMQELLDELKKKITDDNDEMY